MIKKMTSCPLNGVPLRWFVFSTLWLFLLGVGCRTAYYNTMEKFGYQKRDILVSKVEDARDSQEDTKEQIQTTLERFEEVVSFDGGDLEDKYDRLSQALERSQTKAASVRDHIADVEKVAGDLFSEWERELSEFSSDSLRASSRRNLDDARGRYQSMIGAMKRAEGKIDPVLSAFRDQVLYLKHHLNARAIAAIQNDLDRVETDIVGLIREMESSISEANAFIETLGGA